MGGTKLKVIGLNSFADTVGTWGVVGIFIIGISFTTGTCISGACGIKTINLFTCGVPTITFGGAVFTFILIVSGILGVVKLTVMGVKFPIFISGKFVVVGASTFIWSGIFSITSTELLCWTVASFNILIALTTISLLGSGTIIAFFGGSAVLSGFPAKFPPLCFFSLKPVKNICHSKYSGFTI